MKIKLVKIIFLFLTGWFFIFSYAYAQSEDKESPSDVENVIAVGGDGKVTLKWESSTDNVGIDHYTIYYGTESLSTEDDTYPNSVKTNGPVTTYDVTGLENGTTYYFAMTAADKNGNESESYSYEKNATAKGSEEEPQPANSNDTTAPTVSSATAINNTEVKVVFSEAIILPEDSEAREFTIEDQEDKSKLEIISASMDENDKSDKTVVLSTEPQVEGRKYLLTAGLNITDVNKNPIVSGTSDTAAFEGKSESASEPEPADDSEGPIVISAVAYSSTKVEVVFSEDITFESADSFNIQESSDETKKIKVIKAEFGANNRTVVLDTENQTGGKEYLITVSGVKDKADNEIQESNASTLFITPQKNLSDIIPPEEVTAFLAKLKGNIVELTWKASINSAGDLADQILYQSLDKGKSYGTGTSLGTKVQKYDVKGLQPGAYTFKLTTKDVSGNESKGVTTSVIIPKTGAGIGFIALISLVFSGILQRKKE